MQEELTSNIIIQIIITICIFLIGIYFHLKIIKLSKKEKGMTWKLDLTNSLILLAHHGHCIIMNAITYIIPDLYIYTGEWFCYTSKVLNYYGTLYTVGHSMIVSILKYIHIVQWKKARNIGKEKVNHAFFWINIIFPGFLVLLHFIVKPNFYVIYDGFARVDRCLGDPNNNWGLNSNRTQIKAHTVCKMLIAPSTEDHFAFAIYILRSVVCWTEVVFEYFLAWNVFEIFLYSRIFSFMRR